MPKSSGEPAGSAQDLAIPLDGSDGPGAGDARDGGFATRPLPTNEVVVQRRDAPCEFALTETGSRKPASKGARLGYSDPDAAMGRLYIFADGAEVEAGDELVVTMPLGAFYVPGSDRFDPSTLILPTVLAQATISLQSGGKVELLGEIDVRDLARVSSILQPAETGSAQSLDDHVLELQDDSGTVQATDSVSGAGSIGLDVPPDATRAFLFGSHDNNTAGTELLVSAQLIGSV